MIQSSYAALENSHLSRTFQSTNQSDQRPRIAQNLSKAIHWHQSGKLKQAEAGYRQVLGEQPDNAEALQLLGVLMHQQGQHDLAESLIQAAIKLDQSNDEFYFNLAEVQRATLQTQAAIANYRKAIEIEGGEADYYFGLGTALVEVDEFQQAIEVFNRALLLTPNDPYIYNNLGNALAETGNFDLARQQYCKALEIDNAFVEAWVNLGNVEKDSGDLDSAIENYRKALSFQKNNTEVHFNLALALSEQGLTDEALSEYRKVIRLEPGKAEAYSGIGLIQRELGDPKAAENDYKTALEINPELVSAIFGLATVYRDIGDFDRAIDCYNRVLAGDSDNVPALTQLGDCLVKNDRYEEAAVQIRKALELEPENAEACFNLGICLQALGQFKDAVSAHRRALTLKPDLAEAAYNLVLIDSSSLSDADLQQLASNTMVAELGDNTHINLHFALAKAYEDRGRFADAFNHLHHGNGIKSRSNPFDPVVYEAHIERIVTCLDHAFFESHRGYGTDSEVPVFIVGMPRSGSTLVEQIIASHPQAYGAGELNDMRILAKRLPEILDTSAEDPEYLLNMSVDTSVKIADAHLQKLHNLSAGMDRVCDKMLGNFLKLGLIYLMFPRARIIHCQRNPLDTGISCYFQNFARGLRFSFDLEHLGIAYRGYRRLMEHWQEVLPMRILDVQYEEMITGQERESRRLIEFCGLDWNQNCLDFYRQQRGVKTASFWQVRQPIYRSSVGRWRRYEEQLKPLIETLGDLADESFDPG